ncbi:hypothetical protein BCR34DRAFT_34212 [Clohesyomyces aquaticus]|uniref:18S rRNA factor 2 n=1 Tax=Clohesyomyces aquaticus TaxID=1231657 RepID=A0A1Y1Z8F1_9PLEO|nr:hypothetical protein BCR34DRAFT_34212 [Clohesyomyces aquaticus]
MTARKRNEWLDAAESEDEDRGYDSNEESRAHILRSTKRQKTEHTSADEEEEEQVDGPEDKEHANSPLQDGEDGDDMEVFIRASGDADDTLSTPRTRPRPKTLKPVKPVKPKKDRSGVIYLSRVPPFMKPSVLRSLLTPYGAINRVYLQQEDSSSRSSRLKSGGSRRKFYLDGWVEFLSKRDAKFVAENLNARIIGGKKGSRWHDEVWNIRYLSNTKWDFLTERLRNENAERAARLRAEIAQNTRENKMFLENVEKTKMVHGIEKKRQERSEGEVQRKADKRDRDKAPRRTFKQNAIKLKGDTKAEDGEEVKRVLSKIF